MEKIKSEVLRQALELHPILEWRGNVNTWMEVIAKEYNRLAAQQPKDWRVLDPEDCEWPADYFDEQIWFDAWPEEMTVRTIAVDPSKGVRDRRGCWAGKLG